MKVLIVAHNVEEAQRLSEYLKMEHFMCDCATQLKQADEMVALYEYDCILLDVSTEKNEVINWLETFASENKKEGIVLLSTDHDIETKIEAFNLGADDFINMPFHPSELLARIKAVVRRKKFDTNGKLYFGNLMVDVFSYKIWVWNNALHLTKKEYFILIHLIANKNRVVTKTVLAEYLWGEDLDSMNSYNFLFAHIKNLRKKLLEAKAGVDIKNSYGIGYQIIEV